MPSHTRGIWRSASLPYQSTRECDGPDVPVLDSTDIAGYKSCDLWLTGCLMLLDEYSESVKNSSQTTCSCRELDSVKLSYQECCQPFHDGRADQSVLPETAEQLMRSRYSAFVEGLAPYLLETWHESTRPQELELDPQMRWIGLEIIKTRSGGSHATRGVVEFAAHYLDGQREAQQHEVSTFVREDGAWFYLDAL